MKKKKEKKEEKLLANVKDICKLLNLARIRKKGKKKTFSIIESIKVTDRHWMVNNKDKPKNSFF